MKKIYIIFILFFNFFDINLFAYQITYQGKIVDNDFRRINAVANVEFKLYQSASGGNAIWQEVHSNVNIVNGLFSVELGAINPINLKFDTQYYLGININNTGEFIPRSKLQATAYVFRARYSDTAQYLENNAIVEGRMTINDTLIISQNVIITDDGKIGIGTLTPTERIEVSGNIKTSGNVTAAAFIGDGAQLTNLGHTTLVDGSVRSNHILNETIINEDISQTANISPTKIDTSALRLGDTQILSGLNAQKIGAGNVDNTEFNYLDGVIAPLQTQINALSIDTNGLLGRINLLESDSQNTEIRLQNLESDSMNTESRLQALEADSVTKNYVDNKILIVNTQLTIDTNYLSMRVFNLESDSQNTENRLLELEADSQNTELRLQNLEADSTNTENRLLSLESDSIYKNNQITAISSQLLVLGNDTSSLANRISNLESDSQNTENRLLELEADSQNTELRLQNLEADSTNTENRLLALEADSVTKSYVNADSTVKLALINTKAPSVSPTFTGNITLPGGIWNSSGNVGIGTTSPAFNLDVRATNPEIAINRNNVSGYAHLKWATASSQKWSLQMASGSDDLKLYNYGASSFIMTLLSSNGNVGIGTETPSDNLHIVGSFKVNTSGNIISIITDASGNVGLGALSQGPKLHISGPFASTSIEATEILRLTRQTVSGVKNANTFGIAVGAFETGINGRSRVDFQLAGTPGAGNNWGNIPDVTVMTLTANGNVGIGTTSPDRAKLVINGSVSYNNGTYGFLNSTGTTGTGSGTNNISIYASDRIVCSEFNAVSDKRIKIEVPKIDKSSDIELINKLRPVNYKMKDEIQHGAQIKKGFFAQEVEKVLPAAVSKSSDFVPDIFEIAQNIEYNDQQKTLKLTLTKPHNLKVNDKVRLVLKDKTVEKKVSAIFSDYVFSVSDFDEKTDKIFVYGKLVDDFRTLNYEHIFTVGIGAIQELNKKIETQNQDLENLKKENAELKQTINYILKKIK